MRGEAVNGQDRLFIESAARVMWADAWARHEEQEIEEMEGAEQGSCNLFGGRNVADLAPPTPQYALLEAARLLGKIEQANGVRLAVIIEAARKACSAAECSDNQGRLCSAAIPFEEHQEDFVREFASDIALEALGHGVSWFDDHERFELPDTSSNSGYCKECGESVLYINHSPVSECRNCTYRELHHAFKAPGRPFIIPTIEFEYLSEADQ